MNCKKHRAKQVRVLKENLSEPMRSWLFTFRAPTGAIIVSKEILKIACVKGSLKVKNAEWSVIVSKGG